MPFAENEQHRAPVHEWVPAFPGSISAPPPVIDPALERNEWAELAYSRPDDFLPVLLAALDAPSSAFLTGPSVEEAFKSHLGSLAPAPTSGSSSASSSTQTIPSLYSILKTFWLPSSPSYFALTASATSARNPGTHRFLYWDPQPLVFNGIACPAPGCGAPLANRGRIRSGPVTVHDLSGPFFVIGCAYVCTSEPAQHAYASTDASVLRALPAALAREFPARLQAGDAGAGADVWNWQARGVSRALWGLVLGGLRAGLARDVILQLVRDVQHGVPESAGARQEEEEAPMEEEEEESAEGDADADAAMPPAPAQPETPSAAQAFNDAWTANSVVASANAGGDAHLHPFSMVFPHPMGYGAAPFGVAPAPAPAPVSAPTKQRAPRHCCKCGKQTCKGKGGRSFCTSACMDCGKFTCNGRSSRRPDKRCESVVAAAAAAADGEGATAQGVPVHQLGPQGAEATV